MSNLKLFSTKETLNYISHPSVRDKISKEDEKKLQVEISIQTNEREEVSTETQTNYHALNLDQNSEQSSLLIQTESEMALAKAWAKEQTSENKLASRKSLYRFLNQSNAVKDMSTLLNNDIIATNYVVNWDEEVKDIGLVHNFSQDNLKVGVMAWNDLGHLAVGYESRESINGWCMDSGMIVIKRSFNAKNESKHTLRIDVPESIVTALDFYPGRGNILAAGTYDGTLKIWKLGSENEKLLCESKVHELYSHKDPICQVQWLKTSADRSVVLAAMSTEGKFSIWTIKNDLAQPVAIFMMNDVEGGMNLGVTSFSFSNIHAGASIRSMSKSSIIPTTDNYFIFGTEVGRTGRAILTGGKFIDTKTFVKGASIPETKPKSSSLEFEYDSRFGYIQRVECSPYHKNLFLSVSSEGLVRIYNVYHATDIISLQPSDKMLMDAQWSPFRPCVVAAGGEDGVLYIYDFTESTVTPSISISVGSSAITQVRFDSENPELIATGDSEGNCKIWRLPNKISSLQPHEIGILRSLTKEEVA